MNHDSTRLASWAPPQAQLIGYILSLLTKRNREMLLKELPEKFAAAGNLLPDIDAGLVEAAEQLLQRLRAKIQQNVKGTVSTSYTVQKWEII